MTLNRIAIIMAAMVLTAGLSACTTGNTGTTKKENKVALPIVEVITPELQRPSYPLILPGELKPFEEVDIFAKARGFVKKLYVDRGSKVKEGQLLALLEAPEIAQQFLSVQSTERKLYEDYVYSKQAYERLLRAAQKSGAVAEIELDRARAEARSDSAAYHSAKAMTGASAQLKDYLRIVAPFDGTIVQRNVSVGALVGENNQTPLFTVAQREKLRLTVAVPEKHAQSISSETKAAFSVINRPGESFQAVLSRSSAVVNQKNRSMLLEFDIDNSDQMLRGGEYAEVKIVLQRPGSTIWVPAKSVVEAQSGTFVLKVTDATVQRIPVITGLRNGEMREIFGEVSPSDKIVKSGSEELEEGAKITFKY